ncbi:hypothetical protein WCP94_004200 [Bilophila wadsworthia]
MALTFRAAAGSYTYPICFLKEIIVFSENILRAKTRSSVFLKDRSNHNQSNKKQHAF